MIDKTTQMFLGDGFKYSLVAILMVFAILVVIILIANVISAIINKTLRKEGEKTTPVKNDAETLVIDENDENLMVAILVATIDYQNEIKKDVRVVSVKEL